MAKWIKAKWYMSAAGGVSITAFYTYNEEVRVDPRTRMKSRWTDEYPTMTTIRPCQGETLHEDSGITLKADEFMIQDNPYNTEDGVAKEGKISPIKAMLKSGRIMLDDYNLECTILQVEAKDLSQDFVVNKKMVQVDMTHAGTTPDRERKSKEQAEHMKAVTSEISAERQEKLDGLMKISCVKANKEEVIVGLFDKGYETLEDVAGSSVEILMTVKHIGKKLAEKILAELNEIEEE